MAKTLRLPIQGLFFDQIVSGEKTVEYRDFTDHYINRIGFNPDEYDQTKHADGIPTPITDVLLVNGYSNNARTASFKVKKIVIEEILGEDGQYLDDPILLFAIYLGEQIS